MGLVQPNNVSFTRRIRISITDRIAQHHQHTRRRPATAPAGRRLPDLEREFNNQSTTETRRRFHSPLGCPFFSTLCSRLPIAPRRRCGGRSPSRVSGGGSVEILLQNLVSTGEEMGTRERRMVFVTVGTTCFDALVKAVDSEEVKAALLHKGYTDLLVQMGRGTYIPSKVSAKSALQVDYFTFSQSIADYIREASLVISHAGSGSIFETLRLGKPLIVVVNEDLMDNHQSELAEELADRKHLLCARPQTLQEAVKAMDLNNLQPYIPGDAKQVVTQINKFLGFPND